MSIYFKQCDKGKKDWKCNILHIGGPVLINSSYSMSGYHRGHGQSTGLIIHSWICHKITKGGAHRTACLYNQSPECKASIHAKQQQQRWRCRFIVWYLARSATRANFTQLPPGHRTCSFISHLNSPESIQPGCHFSAHRTIQTHKPSLSYQVPTYSLGRESACVSNVPCLRAQRRSIFSVAGDRTGDLSLVHHARYHWAMTPHSIPRVSPDDR